MPTGRKERPPMTKPREKTREELTAEIEDSKKKIRQYENREKMLRQKLSREERRKAVQSAPFSPTSCSTSSTMSSNAEGTVSFGTPTT